MKVAQYRSGVTHVIATPLASIRGGRSGEFVRKSHPIWINHRKSRSTRDNAVHETTCRSCLVVYPSGILTSSELGGVHRTCAALLGWAMQTEGADDIYISSSKSEMTRPHVDRRIVQARVDC